MFSEGKYYRHVALRYACVATSCLLCLIFLIACDSGATHNSQTKTASPTPGKSNAVPAGTVLYRADWSHGLSGWHGNGWTVQQGQLTSQGGDEDTIVAPYQPAVANYAIEFHIRITRYVVQSGGDFAFVVSKTANRDGYDTGVSRLLAPGPRPKFLNPQAQILLDPPSPNMEANPPFDYDPLMNWHVWRLEVRGDLIIVKLDTATVFDAYSARSFPFSSGPLTIQGHGVALQISNFTITAL